MKSLARGKESSPDFLQKLYLFFIINKIDLGLLFEKICLQEGNFIVRE